MKSKILKRFEFTILRPVKYFSSLLVLFCITQGFSQTLESSNLPIVLITANKNDIPDASKIMTTMKVIYNGPGQLNHVTDAANAYDGFIGIERRGSTSQGEKSPFGFETRLADGTDNPVALLGMPSESDWVLLAPYTDKSLVREPLTYLTARNMMAWAPRVRFCEVVLNGSYEGIYILAENIKRDKNRVNISKLTTLDLTGDDVTGGYIVKIDKTTGETPVAGWSGNGTFYQYHYPKADEILAQQKTYINNALQQLEQALYATNYKSLYPDKIDTDTFVDFLIVNELTRNVDGYRLSTFLHKDKDSNNPKWKMGPVWDFNITLGNADYCNGGLTTGYAFNFNSVCPDHGQIPVWWQRLWADDVFKSKVAARWFSLRENLLATETLHTRIDSMTTVLSAAQVRNFQRWPILNHYVWPNAFPSGTYAQHVNYLKTWITNRTNWLDQELDKYLIVNGLEDHVPFLAAPNPARRNQPITFTFQAQPNDKAKIYIRKASGEWVEEIEKLVVSSQPETIKFSNPNLAPGFYLTQFYLNGKLKNVARILVID